MDNNNVDNTNSVTALPTDNVGSVDNAQVVVPNENSIPVEPVQPSEPIQPIEPVQPIVNNTITDTNNVGTQTKKKSIIPIIIIVLIILGIVGVILKFTVFSESSEDKKESTSAVLNKDYIIPYKDKETNLYGFMNANGKTVIEPKYDDFEMIGKMYYASDKENSEKHYINPEGEVKLVKKSYSGYLYDGKGDWLIGDVLYDEDLNPLTSEDMKVDDLYSYKDYLYYTYVKQTDNKCGIVNRKGEIIFEEVVENNRNCQFAIGNKKYANFDQYAIYYSGKEVKFINLDKKKVVHSFEPEVKVEYIYADTGNIFQVLFYKQEGDEKANRKWFYLQDDEIKIETPLNPASDVLRHTYDYNISIRRLEADYYNDKNDYYNLCTGVRGEYEIEKCGLEQYVYVDTEFYDYTIDKELNAIKDDKTIVDGSKYNYTEYPTRNVYAYMKANGKDYVYAKNKDSGLWEYIDINSGEVDYTCKYAYSDTTFCKTSESVDGFTFVNFLTGKEHTFSSDKLTVRINYIIEETKDKKTYYNTKFEKIYEINKTEN